MLLLGGCVDKKVSGDVTSYSFSLWVPLVVLLIGLAAAPLGFLLRNQWQRGAWLGFILAPILLLFVVPGLFLDYCKVDSRHFEGRYGFWFAPSKFDIRYGDLNSIHHVIWTERGRRGRRTTKERFDCALKSGEAKTVQLGDMMKHARDEIAERANAAGVKVTETDERD
jgi:hypothetical protein